MLGWPALTGPFVAASGGLMALKLGLVPLWAHPQSGAEPSAGVRA